MRDRAGLPPVSPAGCVGLPSRDARAARAPSTAADKEILRDEQDFPTAAVVRSSQATLARRANNLLLRPTEVLSRSVPNPAVLKVAHYALGGPLQHHHVVVRRLA